MIPAFTERYEKPFLLEFRSTVPFSKSVTHGGRRTEGSKWRTGRRKQPFDLSRTQQLALAPRSLAIEVESQTNGSSSNERFATLRLTFIAKLAFRY